MAKGKQKCKILKEIRKQIADANDIEYVVSECKFKGNCRGTCPKCESEVRYLEEQLEHRRMLGKAVVLAGISMNVIAANASPAMPPIDIQQSDTIEVVDSAHTITGRVLDRGGEPVIGASIFVKGNKKLSTVSNLEGYFSLPVDSFPQTITIAFIGLKTIDITATEEKHLGLTVVLEEDEDVALQGEVYIVYPKHKKKKEQVKLNLKTENDK